MVGPALVQLDGAAFDVTEPVPARILGPLDLRLERGESVAVVGPSGAGKSTLVSLLGGTLPVTSGSYRFGTRELAGASTRSLAEFRAGRVGFVFQAAHLIEDRTALANVELALTVTGHRDTPTEVATEALWQAGVAHLAGRPARFLSGGERQRVALARAIVRRPALLIADEPTGSLDRSTGHHVLDLLCALPASGTTLVLVTHDPDAAERTDRSVRIVDGQLR